jgi:glycosyltransferase involved in cell wall biosynthesis
VRVLVVSSYGGLGGAELATATFVEHRPPGFDVEALLVSPGPLAERLDDLGVPTWAASGYEGRPGPREPVRFSRGLRRLLRSRRPDVVWAVGQKAALLSVAGARAEGVPIVWHKVDFSWDSVLPVPLAAAVDGVITVSDAVAVALGPMRGVRHLGVVGPPLALPRDLRAEPAGGEPAIGTLARLVPYKGQDRIVRAAALLAPEFPSLRVVLAGTPEPQYPDYPDRLRALAHETGLGERVEMPGFVRPVDVLPRLTVFVNATYRDEEGFGLEGLSGAMLEASWAGVPVVATRAGGTAEGVLDGRTGTLVDEADPELLARAIAPYLRDPELAAATGRAGMEFARASFAPETASKRLFELLASARG